MNIDELLERYPEIVIFDTEYTTWEGAMERDWSLPHEHRELVQLAAAIVSLPSKTITNTFNVVVKPRINPVPSQYFTDLTGITAALVEAEGIDFILAYQQFLVWVTERPCFSYAHPKRLIADAEIFIENLALYDEPETLQPAQFKNIRPVFDAAGVPTEEYNSGKLHQYFNLPIVGQEHNALHDVHSLAESLFALY
jgi:inhibitor of KinA sporulation pathway (predicted exonuclease)